MSLDQWMAHARVDAERRGLPELVPLLESLRMTLARLRAADWNDELQPRSARASHQGTPAAGEQPERRA